MLPQQPQFDGEQLVRIVLQLLSNALPQWLGQRRKIKELEARNASLIRTNAKLVASNTALRQAVVAGLVFSFVLIFLWMNCSSKQA